MQCDARNDKAAETDAPFHKKRAPEVGVGTAGGQTGEIVASIPIRMVNVRNPPRKIAILFMLLSSMLSLRCTGRFGMKEIGRAHV